MTERELFIRLLKDNVKRDGVNELISWLDTTDFFKAPASTRFHEAFEGGLCRHSLNVYYHLVFLNRAYGYMFNVETITIVSLLHDLCKINCYAPYMKNVKDEESGTWCKVKSYQWNEENNYGFHGPKSVYIVMSFMKLGFDEAGAIACHMGVENGNCGPIMDAYRTNPLAFLLHMADMASTIEAFDYISGTNKNDDGVK